MANLVLALKYYCAPHTPKNLSHSSMGIHNIIFHCLTTFNAKNNLLIHRFCNAEVKTQLGIATQASVIKVKGIVTKNRNSVSAQ